jgi:hypothetical protein
MYKSNNKNGDFDSNGNPFMILKNYHNIDFKRIAILSRKLGEIAENGDHNIDPNYLDFAIRIQKRVVTCGAQLTTIFVCCIAKRSCLSNFHIF